MPTDTIEVVCLCGRATRVPSSSAGRKGRCKACGHVIQVPLVPDQDPDAVPIFVAEEDEPSPPPKKVKASRQTDDDFSPEENAIYYLKAIERHTKNISHCVGCLTLIVLLMFAVSVGAAALGLLGAAANSVDRQERVAPGTLKR